MSKLQEHVAAFLSNFGVERCFVACSGGVDSMAMLHALYQSGKPVHALHVNYGLRGDDSDADEALVRSFCDQKSIPLSVLKLNLKELLETDKGNLQARAREIRRSFFLEHIGHSTDGIFLAHHLDDQIETFFLALSRGGGLRALACMADKRDYFYRPFLLFKKQEIHSYALENHVPWREDASNSQTYYSRNRWRQLFLPELKNLFPELEEQVLFLVNRFQKELTRIQKDADGLKERFLTEQRLDFNTFDSCDEEVLRELLQTTGFSYGTYKELKKLRTSEKGASVQIEQAHCHKIFKESDHFYFQMEEVVPSLPKLKVDLIENLPISFDKETLYLDPEKISGELRLRVWMHGDRIKPIGLQGSKLISDILTDAKIPAFAKAAQYVVCDDEKILWCVGHSISREALATPDSKKLKVTLTNICPPSKTPKSILK
ncbi:MAG: tRNA lysidine(34) synthetase TilS [Bacteroidota bacterium]|jgi:tRNA(Ile)-lysidine synthase